MTNEEAVKMLRTMQRTVYLGNRKFEDAIECAIKALSEPLQPWEVLAAQSVLSQPEPHWVPVTERLPETDDEVLTTYIVNGNRKKRYVETSRYYDGFDGQWSSPWDEYRIPGTRIEVIAWMPLPEPYKGVTE